MPFDSAAGLSRQGKVKIRSTVNIPLENDRVGTFITFTGFATAAEHFAVSFGATNAEQIPLVRLHSECITGDVFGSLRCDCGAQLEQAMDVMGRSGGILLYLRQEGRGIGLAAKLDAYKLQEQGLDTYAANRALSLPADARDYQCGADMLQALGVGRIRLLTNNPDKATQLAHAGIEVVECVSTRTFLTAHNREYLAAKVRVTGHHLAL